MNWYIKYKRSEEIISRPTVKSDLLSLSGENLKKLFDFIDSIPKDLQERYYSLNDRNRNIRGVLCRLEKHIVELLKKRGMPAIQSNAKETNKEGKSTWKVLGYQIVKEISKRLGNKLIVIKNIG